MKKKIFLTLTICVLSILLVACGQEKVDTKKKEDSKKKNTKEINEEAKEFIDMEKGKGNVENKYKEFLKEEGPQYYAFSDIDADGKIELLTSNIDSMGIRATNVYYADKKGSVKKAKLKDDSCIFSGAASSGGFRGGILLLESGGIENITWSSGSGEGYISIFKLKDGKMEEEMIAEGNIQELQSIEKSYKTKDIPWKLNLRPIEEIEQKEIDKEKKAGRDVYKGTIRYIDSRRELLDMQNIEDDPISDEYGRREDFILLVFDNEQDVVGLSGDGSRKRVRKANMLLFEEEDYLRSEYIGKKVYISVDSKDVYFPSDARIPLGEPGVKEFKIIK